MKLEDESRGLAEHVEVVAGAPARWGPGTGRPGRNSQRRAVRHISWLAAV